MKRGLPSRQRFQQLPRSLFAGIGFQQLFQVAEDDGGPAEQAACRIRLESGSIRSAQQRGGCGIGANDCQRVQPFHQQEQRLGIQGDAAAFRLAAIGQDGCEQAGVLAVAEAFQRLQHRVSRCVAEGILAYRQHGTRLCMAQVVAEQAAHFVRWGVKYVILRHFRHTTTCVRPSRRITAMITSLTASS